MSQGNINCVYCCMYVHTPSVQSEGDETRHGVYTQVQRCTYQSNPNISSYNIPTADPTATSTPLLQQQADHRRVIMCNSANSLKQAAESRAPPHHIQQMTRHERPASHAHPQPRSVRVVCQPLTRPLHIRGLQHLLKRDLKRASGRSLKGVGGVRIDC